jgi:hypothetical protein
MPRGGARPGAGRKPKAKPVDAAIGASKKPAFTAGGVQTAAAPKDWPFGTKPPADPAPEQPKPAPQLENELDALTYLQRIYRDPTEDPKARFQAAIQAVPYEVAKPGVTGKKAAKDEAAKKAHSRFAPSAPPKLAAVAGRKV